MALEISFKLKEDKLVPTNKEWVEKSKACKNKKEDFRKKFVLKMIGPRIMKPCWEELPRKENNKEEKPKWVNSRHWEAFKN